MCSPPPSSSTQPFILTFPRFRSSHNHTTTTTSALILLPPPSLLIILLFRSAQSLLLEWILGLNALRIRTRHRSSVLITRLQQRPVAVDSRFHPRHGTVSCIANLIRTGAWSTTAIGVVEWRSASARGSASRERPLGVVLFLAFAILIARGWLQALGGVFGQWTELVRIISSSFATALPLRLLSGFGVLFCLFPLLFPSGFFLQSFCVCRKELLIWGKHWVGLVHVFEPWRVTFRPIDSRWWSGFQART